MIIHHDKVFTLEDLRKVEDLAKQIEDLDVGVTSIDFRKPIQHYVLRMHGDARDGTRA
jgi:hypothetical protein